jgi:hypothetical protein
MLLHLNFLLEWFDSNSKQDSKSFENALKYLKRKKRNLLPFLAFGPVAQSFPAARLLPRARRSSLRRLGQAQPMAQQASMSTLPRFLSSLRVADIVVPSVRRHLLPSHDAGDGFLSFASTDRIRLPYPFLV